MFLFPSSKCVKIKYLQNYLKEEVDKLVEGIKKVVKVFK